MQYDTNCGLPVVGAVEPSSGMSVTTLRQHNPERKMTGEQLSECLRTLGWSARELARRVNRGERLIRRMCEGREEIPDNLADWVRQLSEIMARQPHLPKNWS